MCVFKRKPTRGGLVEFIIMIGLVVAATCHANTDQSIDEKVQIRWYEAVKHYDDVLKEASLAEINDKNCKKKLKCDKSLKPAYYYEKPMADAKARLDAANKKLYSEIDKVDH